MVTEVLRLLSPQGWSGSDGAPRLPHLLTLQPPAAALAAAHVCPTVLHALVSTREHKQYSAY